MRLDPDSPEIRIFVEKLRSIECGKLSSWRRTSDYRFVVLVEVS